MGEEIKTEFGVFSSEKAFEDWKARRAAKLAGKPLPYEEPEGHESMTVAELRAALEGRGVEIPEKAKKADLVELYLASEGGSEE